ncbi:SusD/RagB family nutrient-binding outer membrane lipoprotein [Fulvivirga sp.]|uniref:SusD/RagB family nutrient-binding outer membrane lipoprotein n=1 Tax=Pseudomonadati TaxID=3379134 RepID=UPI0032EBB74C
MKILFKYKLLLIALLLTATACEDNFLEINKDPNNPTDVPVSVLLPAIEARLAYSYGGAEYATQPAHFVHYYAGHRNQHLRFDQWDIQLPDNNNYWNTIYAGVLQDIQEMETRALASESFTYVGIGKVLRALSFAMLTDGFGDIPYEEALKVSEVITPAYDTQESIYPKLIAMLDDAILDLGKPSFQVPGSDDYIYGGSTTSWIKFANSLKLRLLNRISKQDASAAINFLNTNPSLIANNSEGAEVAFVATATQENPMYQLDNLSGFQDNALSAQFLDRLTNLNDPRIPHFFEPITNGGGRAGKASGLDDDDSGRGKYSRIGAVFAAADAPVPFITFAEVQFIIAEVQFRAGNTGAAQTAYETAVAADLERVSNVAGGKREINLLTASNRGANLPTISATEISDYLAQPEVAYNGTLARIMEQKYISNFVNPAEAWYDWRRTGLPANFTIPSTNFTVGVRPRKLPYPQNEINFNSGSLSAGPGIPVKDVTLLNRVWWDQ